MRKPHIMLFDILAGGHHGQYVWQLADYWARQGLVGTLHVVVTDHFFEVHRDLRTALEAYSDAGVQVSTFRPETDGNARGSFQLARADWAHGRVLKAQIERVRPDHCVLMYMDRFQLGMAADLKFEFAVGLSGIYFRPSFHYDELMHVRSSVFEKVRGGLKRRLLRAALHNPHFSTLFALDPFVVPFIRKMKQDVTVVHLPDGIVPRATIKPADEIREEFNVETGRKVLLLFGALDDRKGYFEVLEAIRRLPSNTCRGIALLLVGPVAFEIRKRADQCIDRLQSERPVQVVERDEFVPDEQIQDIVRAADLVLLTYQRHVGSSMVLVRAAQAQVPVVGPDYGAVGATIRRHRLGYSVDTTDPDAIAVTIAEFMESPAAVPFDAAEASNYASENTSERMAEVFFRQLGLCGPHRA